MSFIIMSQKVNSLRNYSSCRYSARLCSQPAPTVCGGLFWTPWAAMMAVFPAGACCAKQRVNTGLTKLPVSTWRRGRGWGRGGRDMSEQATVLTKSETLYSQQEGSEALKEEAETFQHQKKNQLEIPECSS